MKRGILFFAVLVFGVFATTCKQTSVPTMMKDESGRVRLTGHYIFPFDAGMDPKVIDADLSWPWNVRVSPVNPSGVGIKSVYKASDRSTHVELNGTVMAYNDFGNQNGIPEGLHAIVTSQTYYPTTTIPHTITDTIIETDYPIPALPYETAAYTDQIKTLMAGKTVPLDIPLEKMISLSGLFKNSKYTAVTVSGLARSHRTRAREKNESLLLFAKSATSPYGGFSAIFDAASIPAYREISYDLDPNLFSYKGRDTALNPTRMPLRGSSIEGGGYNVLIWDGAAETRGWKKQAQFDFSYDYGRTWERTVVDWSDVKFTDVPLQYMAWYVAEIGEPYPYGVLFKPPLPTLPTLVRSPIEDGVYEDFSATIYGLIEAQPSDNFVFPSFYPANSTEKKVYVTVDNQPVVSVPNDDPNDPRKLKGIALVDGNLDGTITISEKARYDYFVEIADRVRITTGSHFRQTDPNGVPADGQEIKIFCNTKPPENPQTPAVVRGTVPVSLTLTIDHTTP